MSLLDRLAISAMMISSIFAATRESQYVAVLLWALGSIILFVPALEKKRETFKNAKEENRDNLQQEFINTVLGYAAKIGLKDVGVSLSQLNGPELVDFTNGLNQPILQLIMPEDFADKNSVKALMEKNKEKLNEYKESLNAKNS